MSILGYKVGRVHLIWTYVQIFVVFFWNSLLNSLRVALFIFWAWIIIKHSTILPRSLLELTGRQADKPLYWEAAPPKMTILDDQLENENKPKNDDDPKIKTNPK